MARIVTTLTLLFLLTSLAGCTSAGIPTGCRDHALPTPRVGDAYTYEASGLFWTPALHVGIADWTLVDGGGAGQPNDALRLPPGSTLTVEARPERPVLNASGALEASHPLAYTVARPGSMTLHFADEHVSTTDGGVVSADQHALWQQEPGRAVHADRLQRRDYPSGFGSSHLWQRPLDDWSGAILVRADRPLPDVEVASMTIHTTVQKVDDGCRATVRVLYDDPGKPTLHEVTATYDGAALPLRYVVEARGRDGTPLPDERFVADRTGHAPGGGPHLAHRAWDAAPTGPSTMLPLQPSEDGFPAGSAPGFDHPLARARADALEDPAVVAWLDRHPSASLHAIEHRDGTTGSDVQDAWTLHYADADASLQVIVTYLDPALAGLPGTVQVDVKEKEAGEEAIPPAAARMPSLAALAGVHQRAYGETAEVLLCERTEGFCAVGTHNNTARLRAGVNGGSQWVHLGIVMGIGDGLLYQRDAVIPWSS